MSTQTAPQPTHQPPVELRQNPWREVPPSQEVQNHTEEQAEAGRLAVQEALVDRFAQIQATKQEEQRLRSLVPDYRASAAHRNLNPKR